MFTQRPDFDAALAVLERVAAVDVTSLDDGALLHLVERVEELGRHIDAARARAAAEVAERSRFELGSSGLARSMGHSRAGHLLEQLTRSSARDVAARIQVGRMTRQRSTLDGAPLPPLYPLVAAALKEGALAIESARVITRNLEDAAPECSPADLARAESSLVSQALTASADIVAIQARIWKQVIAPDGTEPREEQRRAKRALRFGREIDGLAHISIMASGLDLAELRATFSSYASPRIEPRFRSDDDVDPADLFRETRSREQRDFDTFMGLVRAGAASDSHRPGPRASITLIARESDIQRGAGAGWLDDVDEPVAIASVNELVCSGAVRRAVVSDRGEVLSLSRAERYFTAAQNAALALRDGGCIWPQCTAPPSWCDSHHIEHWSKGGTTDVANGALLCPAHHRLLHASDFELAVVDGAPHLRAPARLDPARTWRRARRHRALEVIAV